MSLGTDFGLGRTNIDRETGIRYGVIPAGDVGQAWFEDAEAEYPPPACPNCETEIDPDCEECPECGAEIAEDQFYDMEPISFFVDSPELRATQSGDDCDIFVTRSEYYTFAPFCSPCAPGACYLRNGGNEYRGEKAYCFGPEWFDGGIAPYPVYRVLDGTLVNPEV